MSKIFITALLATTYILGTLNKGTEYPTCGTIVSVNYDTDVAVFEDLSGNKWGFYGVEDFIEGDIVAVTMNDKGTDIIYDDEIVRVKYCGYKED